MDQREALVNLKKKTANNKIYYSLLHLLVRTVQSIFSAAATSMASVIGPQSSPIMLTGAEDGLLAFTTLNPWSAVLIACLTKNNYI
jgi:hypothetical protein